MACFGDCKMKNLTLDRPLVIFDLETTGTDPVSDRIVQIGLIRIELDGSCRTFVSLIDPQRPIPPQATAIHGITNVDVAGKPTFREIVPELSVLLEDADLAGYNSVRFDLPLLAEELHRAGRPLDMEGRRHLDAMVIFHQKEPRHLEAALRFYCDKELTKAHDALADASATLEVLDAQLGRYPDLPRDVTGLHQFCNQEEGRWVDASRKFAWTASGEAVFGFGKHRGKGLRAVAASAPDYLEWIISSDFSEEVKQIARDALEGNFPKRA